jgi:hypothetical protein
LPTGYYWWCVDYYDENTGWGCYIRKGINEAVAVDDHDPTELLIANATTLYNPSPRYPGTCTQNWRDCWGPVSEDIIVPPGLGAWPGGSGSSSGTPGASFRGPRGVFVTVLDGFLVTSGCVSESPLPYSNSIVDGYFNRSDPNQVGSTGEEMWLKVDYDVTGCEASYTYYFDIDALWLVLVRAVDSCGQETYPDEYYEWLESTDNVDIAPEQSCTPSQDSVIIGNVAENECERPEQIVIANTAHTPAPNWVSITYGGNTRVSVGAGMALISEGDWIQATTSQSVSMVGVQFFSNYAGWARIEVNGRAIWQGNLLDFRNENLDQIAVYIRTPVNPPAPVTIYIEDLGQKNSNYKYWIPVYFFGFETP